MGDGGGDGFERAWRFRWLQRRKAAFDKNDLAAIRANEVELYEHMKAKGLSERQLRQYLPTHDAEPPKEGPEKPPTRLERIGGVLIRLWRG